MSWYELARWLHMAGAAMLLGTGSGIAFFMLMAHRTGDARLVAHVAATVVLADYLFTAIAVVAQPLTGIWLAHLTGWSLTTPWIMLSLGLYLCVGALWLPVVGMQTGMRDIARAAAARDQPLPADYHALFRKWFTSGVPAFVAVLAILWLMVVRPVLW
jgi:uncharacterized membrane protein